MSLRPGLKPIEVPLFPAALKPAGHIFPRSRPPPRLPSASRGQSRGRRTSSRSEKQAEQSENVGLSAALTRVLRRLLVEPRGVLEPKAIVSSRIESVLALRRIGDNTSSNYSTMRDISICSSSLKPNTAKDSSGTASICLRTKAIRAASTLPKQSTAADLVVNSHKLRLRTDRSGFSRSRARPVTSVRPESAVIRSVSVPRAELLTRDTQTDFREESQALL